MMPWEPTRDVMRRTMENLRFIERHANSKNGPYEVTQLVNSVLGALAHPWEQYRDQLNEVRLEEMPGWPCIRVERVSDDSIVSVGDLLRLLRNAIAHGNIEYLSDGYGAISALRLQNRYRGKRTWGTTLAVADLRKLLDGLAALIEDIAREEIASRRARA